MTDHLFRDVGLPCGRVDVAVSGGHVTAVGAGLRAGSAEVIDGHGAPLLPGLHDHHLHLHALAAHAGSVSCGPPHVHTAGDLAAALTAAPGSDWIRGVGYVETVAGLLDAAALDRLHAHRPVRLQHRSGALWILNSTACERVRLDSADHPGVERDDTGRPTGRLWRADAWLRDRLPRTAPPALSSVAAELTRFGITGVTDATPDLSPTSLSALLDAHLAGSLPQRLHLLGVPLDEESGTPVSGPADAPEGGPNGRGFPDTVTTGPYKIVVADSGPMDFGHLSALVRRAHARRRPVAVHCVSRVALLLLLAVFDEVGTLPGDRIEHGALIPGDSVGTLRAQGQAVVTQPGFLAVRGDDYRRRVDPDDLPDLYRCRSLLDAGIPLALSSDAPYGPLNPWTVIAAATTRRTPTGETLGPAERLTVTQALRAYLASPGDPGGPARTIRPGAPADLVLLDRPLGEAVRADADPVRATMIRGDIHHRR
ncbi:MAG TPA: amidohydrolase family protein [Nocardia sp.]|uniref:amidohydrolase family protein n=1 Tax=Nocardia TaxID=1817 RepID=UPI0024556CF0|nr:MULTISPECIES: amidohydrolase family protein [Nocardia]HLS76494.1 amidohydrolase family protein [Nocardia sp.]